MKKPYTADEKVMAREQAFLHTDEQASPPACCLRADCLNSICSLHAAYQLHTCCPPVYCLVSARFRPAICLDKPTGYSYSYTYSHTLSMQPACCLPPFALLHVAWNPVYPQSSSCLPYRGQKPLGVILECSKHVLWLIGKKTELSPRGIAV